MIPTFVPGATTVPGLKGTAPTLGTSAFPGIDSDDTTLWLAFVPSVHGVFK